MKDFFYGVFCMGLVWAVFEMASAGCSSEPIKDVNAKEAAEERPATKLKDPYQEYFNQITVPQIATSNKTIDITFRHPNSRKLTDIRYIVKVFVGDKLVHSAIKTARDPNGNPKGFANQFVISLGITEFYTFHSGPHTFKVEILSATIDGLFVASQ